MEAKYISASDFKRFIDAKIKNPECLRCGGSGWDIHDSHERLGQVGLVFDSTGKHAVGSIYTFLVTLSCKTCGTYWTLDRKLVQNWLADNPAYGHGAQENEHGQ